MSAARICAAPSQDKLCHSPSDLAIPVLTIRAADVLCKSSITFSRVFRFVQ